MDPATIINIGVIVVPILIAVTGYIFNALNNRISANKADTDRKLEQMDAELRSVQQKEDAVREIARVDRDLANLRDDFSKGFDRLYEAMSENKRELLAAITSLRDKQ